MQSVERDFTFITKIDGLRQMRFRSGDQKRTTVLFITLYTLVQNSTRDFFFVGEVL